MKVKSLSCVRLFATPWAVAYRVAISFSRGASHPRDRTRSPALWADALPSEPLARQATKVGQNSGVRSPEKEINRAMMWRVTGAEGVGGDRADGPAEWDPLGGGCPWGEGGRGLVLAQLWMVSLVLRSVDTRGQLRLELGRQQGQWGWRTLISLLLVHRPCTV